jgi:hypothetical protein
MSAEIARVKIAPERRVRGRFSFQESGGTQPVKKLGVTRWFVREQRAQKFQSRFVS